MVMANPAPRPGFRPEDLADLTDLERELLEASQDSAVNAHRQAALGTSYEPVPGNAPLVPFGQVGVPPHAPLVPQGRTAHPIHTPLVPSQSAEPGEHAALNDAGHADPAFDAEPHFNAAAADGSSGTGDAPEQFASADEVAAAMAGGRTVAELEAELAEWVDETAEAAALVADVQARAEAAAQKVAPRHDPSLTDNAHLKRWRAQLETIRQRTPLARPLLPCGRLTRAAGLVLEAVGIRLAVGSGCLIELPPGSGAAMAEAEVVGFGGDRLYLMPTTEVAGLLPGARVYPLESSVIADSHSGAKRLPVGFGMLGRVIDAAGRPLDGLGALNAEADASLQSSSINPLLREPIHEVLDVGVRAINALLTVGRGQRMGLFAGSGVGKSVLLGMMARYTSADVIVVGLIGERGREVKEFIEQILGPQGLARSVVVAAPADVSPLLRLQGAAYATSLAEYFRDQGRNVLLIMDSLTRYAMAQREIALAIGEPPATKGYPPSVFAKLPALVERTGNGPEGGGSITAFYTVLTEGDDQQDPIADSARAILDGHIVLSRVLAESGHYPAIDIEASISRVAASIIDDGQLDDVRHFKQMLSRYQRNRDLINVGAYTQGRDPLLDKAISLYPKIESFLQQKMHERCDNRTSVMHLNALISE